MAWGFKEAVEGVRIKVDFEKAYDKVNWSFLRKVLELLGFNDKWCGWISECICNSKLVVLINGVATKWIKSKRGVRQDDPLYSHLFPLVVEGLTRMTKRAKESNLLKIIGPTRGNSVTLI